MTEKDADHARADDGHIVLVVPVEVCHFDERAADIPRKRKVPPIGERAVTSSQQYRHGILKIGVQRIKGDVEGHDIDLAIAVEIADGNANGTSSSGIIDSREKRSISF